MKKGCMTALSVILLLVIWQGVAMYMQQPKLIPEVPAMLKSFGELFLTKGFYMSVFVTVLRGMSGMFLSFVAAVLFALLFARVEWLYDLFRPLITIMRSVPVISFILLALIFLHAESIPLLIGFLTMFPLLAENLTKGISNLRPGLSRMARQFRFGRYNRWALVYYPQLKPFLFSGLASAAGFGWRAVIMGEVLSLCSYGIGSEMKRAQSFIEVPELISWTIIAILIGYVTDKIISHLSKHVFYPTYLRKAVDRLMPHPLKEFHPSPIVLKHVGYKYGVSDFVHTFKPGRIYGISAPSGAGKTTLLNMINGTLEPVKGELTIDRTQDISFVFQDMELLPELSVLDNVALPLARILPEREAHVEAMGILQEFGLQSYYYSSPALLSYGQQQRVAIARALIFQTPCLLMDEPFKGIDIKITNHIIRFIRSRQQKTHQTIIFTSHNPNEMTYLADEVVTL